MNLQTLNRPFIYRIMILSVSLGLILPAVAADFETTMALAEQGEADAQYNLGVKYDNGRGVDQDHAKVDLHNKTLKLHHL